MIHNFLIYVLKCQPKMSSIALPSNIYHFCSNFHLNSFHHFIRVSTTA